MATEEYIEGSRSWFSVLPATGAPCWAYAETRPTRDGRAAFDIGLPKVTWNRSVS